MPTKIQVTVRSRFDLGLIVLTAFVLLSSLSALADDAGPQVTLNISKAAPRTVEALTERAVLRDYKFAWTRISQALETNSPDLMNGLLEGTASTWLNDEIKSQLRGGMSSRYLNQSHKVDAVFYAPEGDLLELHDTAEYDLQISDGGKMIHNQHVAVRYVVLMTPGADRWVVRQIQSVPEF